MSWQIKIPLQSRSQTIKEALEAGVDRAVEGEDRDVTFQLLLDPPSGVKTMGDLADHVDALDAGDRRRLLNEKRVAAGLMTVEDEEGHAAYLSANRAILLRRVQGPQEPTHEIDFRTMTERPIGKYAERLQAEEERRLQALRESDALKRAEAEERRRATGADPGHWKPPVVGGPE